MPSSEVISDLGRFAIVPEWLFDADVSANAIRLFGILAVKYADRQNDTAQVKRKRLMTDTHVGSIHTLDAALKELVRVNALTVEHRTTSYGDQDTNLYILHFLDRGRAKSSPTGRAKSSPPVPEGSTPEGSTLGTPSATQTGAAAPADQAKRGRSVVLAVLEHCRRDSIPLPDRIARTALGQQSLNLIRGGYDERDVRAVAIELAGAFTLYDRHKALMTLQNTVQQRYAGREYAEHVERKEASKAVAPNVAPLLGGLGRMPHRLTDEEAFGYHDKRCAHDGCDRHALYGLERCANHEPREASGA